MITETLCGYEAISKNHPTGSIIGIHTIVSFNNNASEIIQNLSGEFDFRFEGLVRGSNSEEAVALVSKPNSPVKAISLRKSSLR